MRLPGDGARRTHRGELWLWRVVLSRRCGVRIVLRQFRRSLALLLRPPDQVGKSTENQGTEDHGTEDHGTDDHDTEDQGTKNHDTKDWQDTKDQGTEGQGTEGHFEQSHLLSFSVSFLMSSDGQATVPEVKWRLRCGRCTGDV